MWGVCLGIGKNVVPPLLHVPHAVVTGVLYSSVGIRYFIFMVISGHVPQNGHKTSSLYS